MNQDNTLKLQKLFIATTLLFALLGVGLRFFHITQPDFIFYDEGYYLNFNRQFVEFVRDHQFQNIEDWVNGIYTCLRLSLATGKALWFFLIDSRAFWGAADHWSLPRCVAALAGSLSLAVVFLFSRRFYSSSWVGYLSVILLAVLPSHVFYSRIGLQETLSTLFFLSGFYFYLFPDKLNVRTFLSALILVAAYFTNYRLIILPVLVLVTEVFLSLTQKRRPDLRKYVWHTVTFGALIVLVGSIDRGQNLTVTFSWMFHQAELGQAEFQIFNFWSYPYYIFRLESIPFGLLFIGNIYFLFRKQLFYLYPMLIALCLMFIFSFAQDKAARYLCAAIPFMAMGVASIIVFYFQERKNMIERSLIVLLAIGTIAIFSVKSTAFALFSSDYRIGVQYLTQNDENVKIVATQSYILNLYTKDKKQVVECPKDFETFLKLKEEGFQYLVLDPQAYISYTEDGTKFSQNLTGFLRFITQNIKPVKVFDHFSTSVLERFVFEHNENLKVSLAFLSSNDLSTKQLRIYDMKQCAAIINIYLKQTNQDSYGQR